MKSPGILEDTAEVLETTIPRVERLTVLSEKEKRKVIKLIKEAAENFRQLSKNVKNDNVQLAEFFFKKAKELKNLSTDKGIEREGKKKYIERVKKMNLYSKSAVYDFDPEMLRELKKAYRTYIFGMTAFFLLVGVYMSQVMAVTALILALPIILSMLSLQRRGYTGLLLAYSAAPIPIIQGVMGLTYGWRQLTTPGAIEKIAETFNKSPEFVKGWLIFMVVLSAVELYLIVYGLYLLYRHRHAFL
ncbi:alpha-glucosidase [Thermococcus henrietii]|uniref:alpha-glucosidase n=1 Tax=Thermococcus henrietii TaxID=2016361 RepID=UPI000C07691E|nr:alpha-glucosidase [Thermococcus henrietii]